MKYTQDNLGRPFVEGSSELMFPEINTIMYVSQEHKVITVYRGKSKKPIVNFKFASQDFDDNVCFYKSMYDQQSKNKIEDDTKFKEKNKFVKENLKVGDIVYSSWGFEQTNIDFYQVVDIKGTSYQLREVNAKKEYNTDTMTGYKSPIVDDFVNDIITTTRLTKFGDFKLSSYNRANMLEFDLIDGKKEYKKKRYSTYA